MNIRNCKPWSKQEKTQRQGLVADVYWADSFFIFRVRSQGVFTYTDILFQWKGTGHYTGSCI